ncbi:MAG: hypothetical protein ACK5MP_00265 [Nostocoides sp.]
MRTYPRSGESGVDHDAVAITEAGLAGDRAKKAPVSLVGNDSPATRANIVLDLPSREVADLVGHRVRIGEVVLAVVRPAGGCPGAYAHVDSEGTVRRGESAIVLDEDTDE